MTARVRVSRSRGHEIGKTPNRNSNFEILVYVLSASVVNCFVDIYIWNDLNGRSAVIRVSAMNVFVRGSR